jgi:hypothetical protein
MDTPSESATQQKFHGVTGDWLAKAEAAQPMGQLVKPHQVAGLAAYLLSQSRASGALIDYDQRVSVVSPASELSFQSGSWQGASTVSIHCRVSGILCKENDVT